VFLRDVAPGSWVALYATSTTCVHLSPLDFLDTTVTRRDTPQVPPQTACAITQAALAMTTNPAVNLFAARKVSGCCAFMAPG